MAHLRISKSTAKFQYYPIQTLKTDRKLKVKFVRLFLLKRHQNELIFHTVTLYVKMHPQKIPLGYSKKKGDQPHPNPHKQIDCHKNRFVPQITTLRV